MLASIFSLNVIQTALELGCIYALVALALFLSYSILNIADLSTDGCFTLGCAVACQVALTGHPFLALLAAMAAGVCSGFVTAFLQTRLGVESIMAGIIVNTGLYTINLAAMGFSSTMSLVKTETIFSLAKKSLGFLGSWYKLVLVGVIIALACAAMLGFLGTRLGLSIRATGDNTAMVTTPPWCGPPASTLPLPLRWACACPVRCVRCPAVCWPSTRRAVTSTWAPAWSPLRWLP